MTTAPPTTISEVLLRQMAAEIREEIPEAEVACLAPMPAATPGPAPMWTS